MSLLPSEELKEIYADPTQLQRLKAFAASTFCEENILFLEQVLQLKTQNPNKPKTAELITTIVNKFINKDSPSQINIDSALQAQIIGLAKNIALEGIQDLNLFDKAFTHIANVVQRDTLPRFKQLAASNNNNKHATETVNRRSALTDSKHTKNATSNSSIISTSSNNSSSLYSTSIHSSLDSAISDDKDSTDPETEEDLRASWYRGHLYRRKGFFGQWKPFTYTKKGKYLFEFKPGANHVTSEPLETIYLENCLVEPAKTITGKSHSFILNTHDGKGYFFQASSDDEMHDWIEELSHFSVSKRNLRLKRRNSIKSNHSSGSDHSGVSHLSGADSVNSYDSQSSHPSISSTSTSHSQSTISTTSTTTTASSIPSSSPSSSSSSCSGHQYTPMVVLDGEELIKALPILNFLESFTDAVVVGDSRGLIVAFNTAAERMFGFSRTEAIGSPLKILMPEPYSTLHDSYMFQYEKHGLTKLIGKTRNLKGLKKTGDNFDLQISLGKLPVHGYFIATIREITHAPEHDED